MRAVPLAKLTRPKLFGAAPRERLFDVLEQRLAHPAVWIAGPPGAGKTTLAASFVEARKRPAVWYQVDSNDADPASFFHYLALAAGPRSGRRGEVGLPALTPEYLPDLAGFTRRFVRSLYARLPRPSLLVLDNYQLIPTGSNTHDVVACALEELPDGIGCIVISREEPPPAFARLLASQSLASIGWGELRLTEEEARAIALARRFTDETACRAAYERCAGWTAGLILMLDQPEVRAVATGIPPGCPESVFHYFAGALFDQLRPQTRKVLLDTAMLSRMTAPLAACVSQVDDAGEELRELYERNCFVDRRVEVEPTYQLHALFREFLLDRIRREASVAQRHDLARRSADALRRFGQQREAAALYAQAGDWPNAIALVVEMAPRLLAQGRWQTLQQCIGLLPSEQADAVPWIQYWSGAAAFATDIGEARRLFNAAFDGFARAADTVGQVLAAAGIIESYCAAYDDLIPAKHWIETLDELVSRDPAFPSVELETHVLSSLVLAMAIATPENPRLDEYERRLMPLIERDIDPNVRAPGAFALMNYNSWLGRMERFQRAVRVGRELVANPMLLPIRKVYVHLGLGYNAYAKADYEESDAQFRAIFALTAEHGLSMLEPFLRLAETWHHLDRGEHRAMAPVVRRAAAAIDPRRRADVSLVHHVDAWLALLEGDLPRAKQEAETALALGIAIGWKYVRPLNLFALAEILIERGEFGEADECVRRVRDEFGTLDGPMLDFHGGLVDAYSGLRQRDEARCEVCLRAALAIGRARGFMNNQRWYAPMMSRLAAFALERGIEVQYVRALIRRHDLVPESPIESWPWPVRVYTLGRFEILRDDEAIQFSGKAQRKPLDLLKVLIALGCKDVAADKLIGILWPEPTEDGGHKALEITVHRLRKLLGSDDAVHVGDRRVGIDPRRVWVDAWALERQLTSVVPSAGEAAPDVSAMERSVASVLKLYRGHFLAGEGEEPWQIPVRNRLSGRFQRFVLRLGEHWEAKGQWQRAAELYARVVDLDPLAESFYCRQMLCLDALGRRAEAIEVFRRLRQALSVTLGIPPNSETLAVHKRLVG